MRLDRLLPICILTLVAATFSAKAQTNVAVCDVDKVLSELDERRIGEAELKRERDRFQDALKARGERIRPPLHESHVMRDDSPPRGMSPEERVMEAIQFEIFDRVEQWRLNTKENALIQRLDRKITSACKRVAEQKKIDLVLIEHTPVIPADLTTLTPDQLRALLKQKTVAYKSDKTDITSDVIAQLNADYAKSERK